MASCAMACATSTVSTLVVGSCAKAAAADAAARTAKRVIFMLSSPISITGNFGDAGVRAGLVLIAAGSAAHANSANDIISHFDRNTAGCASSVPPAYVISRAGGGDGPSLSGLRGLRLKVHQARAVHAAL